MRWRCDGDISPRNFKLTMERLREVSKGASETSISTSNICIPTSNIRKKWKLGAEVEVEGIKNDWWYAKVTGCNDDGTYNAVVDDDHPEGGQEWENVRPVYLRSRVQAVRPTGIVRRHLDAIPRWDEDGGAAFLALQNKLLRRYNGTWVSTDNDESDDSDSDEFKDMGESNDADDTNVSESEPGTMLPCLTADETGHSSAADKATTRRPGRHGRRRKRNHKRKNGRWRRLSGRKSKSLLQRFAESTREANSSEQIRTDAEAKTNKDSKRSLRHKNGQLESENGRVSISKTKAIPRSTRRKADLHRTNTITTTTTATTATTKHIVCKIPLAPIELEQDSAEDPSESKQNVSSDDSDAKFALRTAVDRLGRLGSTTPLLNEYVWELVLNIYKNEDKCESPLELHTQSHPN